MRIPFFEPTYNSRSYDFEAQRCVNFYPELDDGGGKKITLRGTPGLNVVFQTPNSEKVRGWHVFGGVQYFVAGPVFYSRTTAGDVAQLGELGTKAGRVAMENNGIRSNGIGGNQIIILDGKYGYLYNIASKQFTRIISYPALQASASCQLSPGVIAHVTLTAKGDYSSQGVTATISDPTGTGASLSITHGYPFLDDATAVNGILGVPRLVSDTPVVSIVDPTGTGAVITPVVQTISTPDGPAKQVTAWTLTSAGKGYAVDADGWPMAAVYATNLIDGDSDVGMPTLDFTKPTIVGVEVIDGGSGYTDPKVVFHSDHVFAAVATATVTRTLAEVVIDDAGSGYIAPPIVSVTGTPVSSITPARQNITGNGQKATVFYRGHGLRIGDYITVSGAWRQSFARHTTPDYDPSLANQSAYNVTSVPVEVVDADHFSYPCTGTGKPSVAPIITSPAFGLAAATAQTLDTSISAITLDGGGGYSGDLTLGISEPEGVFFPDNPQSVAFIDGYFIISVVDSMNLYACELYDGSRWNPLAFAAAEAAQDNVQAVMNLGQQLLIVKEHSSELWSDVAIPTSQGFPFQRIAGAVLDFGAAGRDSITSSKAGGSLFAIGQAKVNGEPQVVGIFEISGLSPRNVAHQGILYRIQQFPTVEDAFSFVQYDAGHVFVWFTFPSGNCTFVYDMTTQMWHERSTAVQTGQINRHTADSYCYFAGTHYVSGAQTSDVYSMSEELKSDYGNPIISIRRAPVLMDEDMDFKAISRLRFDCLTGVGTTGPSCPAKLTPVVINGTITAVVVNDSGADYLAPPNLNIDDCAGTGAVLTPVIEQGRIISVTVTAGGSGYAGPTISVSGPTVSPYAALSWSDDGGKTWSNEYLRPMGDEGQSNTILEFRRLGAVRHGRIFQLSVSDPVKKVFRNAMVNR